MAFDNIERNRYYGIRIGDTISFKAFGRVVATGIVISYGMDNNKVTIEDKKGAVREVVAEWCNIDMKIEDKLK